MGPLINCAELKEKLGADNLRVYDCSVSLIKKPEGGYQSSDCREQWLEEHIPGAGYIDLLHELSDRSSSLLFMMPPQDQFVQAMSDHGIDSNCDVVLYNRGPGFWAKRVWWMLRAFGFDRASVLDGGWEQWKAQGLPVASGPEAYPANTFSVATKRDIFVDSATVLAALEDKDTVMINALTPEVFRGEVQAYARPGRIPGSVNVTAPGLYREDQTLRGPEELAEAFNSTAAMGAPNVINYCGGGISAATNAFALHLLGHTNVQIYDGSMSEWAQNPDLPMETG